MDLCSLKCGVEGWRMCFQDPGERPAASGWCLGYFLSLWLLSGTCLVLWSDILHVHQRRERGRGLEIWRCGMCHGLLQTRIRTENRRHFRTLESERNRRVLYKRGGQRECEMVHGLSLMFSSWASVVKGQCVSRHASGSPRTPWRPSSLAPLLRFYPLIRKASCFSLFIYLSFPQSSSHHTPPNPPPPTHTHTCSLSFSFSFLTLLLLQKHVKNLILSER